MKSFTLSTSKCTVLLNVHNKIPRQMFWPSICLQVSYPPFLFEAHLQEKVVDQESRAQVGNGVAHFVLKKKEEGLWGQLSRPTEADSTGRTDGERCKIVGVIDKVS